MSAADHAAAAALTRLAMALDGAILGLTLAAFAAHTWSSYLFSSRALKSIRSAPHVLISDLRSLLSPSSDTKDEGMLVVVRGSVQEKSHSSALLSHGNGEKAVVVQRVQTCLYNEFRGIFRCNFDLYTLFARTRKEQQSYSIRLVPFVLAEGAWPYQASVVVKLGGSSHRLPLTTSFHQLLPVPASSSSFFHAIFGSGFPVAILDEEKILPVGKVVTAVGMCRLDNGVIEINSSKDLPCFLSDKTKNEIEVDLSFNSGVLFWSGVILGTLSVGILGYSIVRNWQKWKEWRRRRHAQQPPDTNVEDVTNNDYHEEEEEELGDIPDGQLCVICLSRRRRSAFSPCGHLVCCPRCAMMVERESSPKCPLCRQSIRSSMRIYAS